MVIIEHYTKWIELVPIRGKSSATTAYAFQQNVLSRFGASAEVVTDGGTEFQGEFQDLLLMNFIDHRTTTPNHPQADGLAERCVQTLKLSLRKQCAEKTGELEWDVMTGWMAMGYRCSPQESTRISPYEMLFGMRPLIPSAAAQETWPLLDVSKGRQEAAAEELKERAARMQKIGVIAGANLETAQHRDGLRYAHIRGGGWVPQVRKFEPGDYVYVQNASDRRTLEVSARGEILRVKRVGEKGTLILEGRCGRTIAINANNCAPCHLVIDGTQEKPAKAHRNLACRVCRMPHLGTKMLRCDGCDTGWHMQCLTPPLTATPEGDWFCPDCVRVQDALMPTGGQQGGAEGIDEEPDYVRLVPLQQQDQQQEEEVLQPEAPRDEPAASPNDVCTARTLRAKRNQRTEAEPSEEERLLDGTAVAKAVKTPAGDRVYVYGTVSLRGPGLFEAKYVDGDGEMLTTRQVKGRARKPSPVNVTAIASGGEKAPTGWPLPTGHGNCCGTSRRAFGPQDWRSGE